MHNQQVINLYKQEPYTDIAPIELSDLYFSTEGKIRSFFMNVLLYFVKRLAPSIGKRTVMMKSVTIDQKKVFDLLFEHRTNIEYMWNKKPKYLICGRDKSLELFQEANTYLNIHIETKLSWENETEIMGCQLIVVPWIDGLFFLPDL